MTQIKISIIVPYKNSARWIERCLISLTKNRGNFEFLFVNDGSTDNGKEMVESFKDERIISLDNVRNPGVGGARNTGLDVAHGDWFGFLDSDDEILLGIYDTYNKAINNTTANMIQFNVLTGKRNGLVVQNRNQLNNEGIYNTDKMPHYWELTTNKIYCREKFSEIRFNEEMKWGEDELFNLECLALDNQIQCNRNNNFIWWHDNVKSLFQTATKADMLKQVEELEKFAARQVDPKIRDYALYWIDFHYTTKKYRQFGLTREK